MKHTDLASVASTLLLSLLLPAVLAHGGEEGPHQDSHGDDHKEDTKYPATYFALSEHAGVMYAHIAVMTIAWVVLLPVAVMLSLAKSQYTLLLQFVFLSANALGVVLAAIYSAKAPDLYPNNAHHKIGWIITAVVAAQVLVGLVGRIASASRGQTRSGEEHAFIPVAMQDNASRGYFSSGYRMSHDSGQDSGPASESLRGHSGDEDDEIKDNAFEDMTLAASSHKGRFASKAAKVVSSRVWKPLTTSYQVIDRIILPFGFVAFATGIATYGRFFEGRGIFSGLAHWIKGGIFFWLGLFSLGRWCGSFAEIGWAWNARPPRRGRAWRPSSEFVESALICFYGCTNIFLEHLSRWGGRWTGRDLEHISITVLFIGGGALGMLVESSRVRELLNTTMYDEASEPSYSDEERKRRKRPKTYEFSLNPVPALVILLLGSLMSSHQQPTMMATMVHKQWGNLLSAASLARTITYVIMYLKPPKLVLPSRPPTELLASFCMISGGIIFMASSVDTIDGMIHYDLDAMFMYTVTLGLVGLLMAWEVTVLALKGWAVRRERRVGMPRN
ncbi:hypothetical protein GGR53DRAFT_462386 [Hypoxylon sp. FL1150]|nr:hypothetical protein GGR53DRAFT_462386 [Hypoxylon sp. FL1150]